MAAPTLSEKESRQSLREKLKVHKPKAHLISPYSYAWPALDDSVGKEVIEKISTLFQSLPLQGKRRLSKAKQKNTDTDTEQTEYEKKRKHLRSQMVIGLNAVTRGLEKDDLDLVIVCRSTEPQLMTKHLIPLAACRQCAAMCIPQFSAAVAPLLGMKSVVSIGFKKLVSNEDSEFSELIKYGQTCAIPITMPWDEDTEDIKPLDVPNVSLPTSAKNTSCTEEGEQNSNSATCLEVDKLHSSVQTKGKHLPVLKKEKQMSETVDENERKTNIQISNIKAEKNECSQENKEKDLQKFPFKNETISKINMVKVFIPKDDYSYLYVFKSKKKDTKEWGDFIALGDDSDSSDTETFCYKYTPPQDTEEAQYLTSLKRRKHPIIQSETSNIPSDIPRLKYKKTKIGHQFKNPSKTKRKKKLKK